MRFFKSLINPSEKFKNLFKSSKKKKRHVNLIVSYKRARLSEKKHYTDDELQNFVDGCYTYKKKEITKQQIAQLIKTDKKVKDDLKRRHPVFMNHTISYYNKYSRYAFLFFLLIMTFGIYLSFYNAAIKPSLEGFMIVHFTDFIYIVIMVCISKRGFIIQGVEIKSLLKVRWRYMATVGVWLDLISLLPIAQTHYLFANSDYIYFSYGSLRVLLRFFCIDGFLSSIESEVVSSTLLYRSLKFLLLSTLFIHIAACYWYAIACDTVLEFGVRPTTCKNDTWIRFQSFEDLKGLPNGSTKENIINDRSYMQTPYISSLYWSSMTVFSVGFGDILPQNLTEQLYATAIMIIGVVIVFGFTEAYIISILTYVNERRAKYKYFFNCFFQEVKWLGVTSHVKNLCRQYYEFVWNEGQGFDMVKDEAFLALPESVRMDIFVAKYKHFFKQTVIFNTLQPSFLRSLSLIVEQQFFLKDQYIQRTGNISTFMYYVRQGQLEIIDKDKNIKLKSRKTYGQSSMIFYQPQLYSVRCVTNCIIFIIKREDFLSLISLYPEEANTFFMNAHQFCLNPWKIIPPDNQRLKITLKNRREKQNINIFTSSRKIAKHMKANESSVIGLPNEVIDDFRKTLDLEFATNAFFKFPDLMFMKYNELVENFEPSKQQYNTQSGVVLPDFDPNKKQSISTNSNSEKDQESKQRSFKKIWRSLTTSDFLIFESDGTFIKYWRIWMCVLSVITFLVITYLAGFRTTGGEVKTYRNGEISQREMLDILSDNCYDEGSSLYKKFCLKFVESTFDELLSCVSMVSGGRVALTFTEIDASNWSVTFPSYYDRSQAPYQYRSDDGPLQIRFKYFHDLFFLISIFVNLCTEVTTSDGVVTRKRSVILKQYFKWNQFWMDFFGLLPFTLFATSKSCIRADELHMFTFLMFNRLVYFYRNVIQYFNHLSNKVSTNMTLVRSVQVVVYLYTATHTCACIAFWLACSLQLQDKFDVDIFAPKCKVGSWASLAGITHKTRYLSEYATSMYWMTATMTTTGYGDITPSRSWERIFLIFVMFSGAILYGYVVVVVALTLSSNSNAKREFHNNILTTLHYLKQLKISEAVIDRMISIRKIQWNHFKGAITPESKKLNHKLSHTLALNLNYDIAHKHIRMVPFFYGCDVSFINQLCHKVFTHYYSKGDVIMYEGDLIRFFYIIKRGSCYIVTKDLSEIVGQIKEGGFFGELQTFFSHPSYRTVVAASACEVLVFRWKDIDEVLTNFSNIRSDIHKLQTNKMYISYLVAAVKKIYDNKITGLKSRLTRKDNIYNIHGGTYVYGTSYKEKFANKLLVSDNVISLRTPYKKVCYLLQFSGVKPFNRIFMFFLRIMVLPVTFEPTSNYYLYYESVRAVLIFLQLMIIPTQIAFYPKNVYLIFLLYLIDISHFIDQIIKSHTTYITSEGIKIRHPLATVHFYLSHHFLMDLLSWLPFELFVFLVFPESNNLSINQHRYISMFRLNRILLAYKLYKFSEFCTDSVTAKYRHLSTLVLPFQILLLHHWTSCCLMLFAFSPHIYHVDPADDKYYFMIAKSGKIDYCSKDSWLAHIYENHLYVYVTDILHSIYEQYFVAFYWSMTSLVGVGYGDVKTSNSAEELFKTIVMILGCVYYSYLLGGICVLIEAADAERGFFYSRLSHVQSFFQLHNISNKVYLKLLQHYEYEWHRTKDTELQFLFHGLPPSFMGCLQLCMYMNMTRSVLNLKGEVNHPMILGLMRMTSTRIKTIFLSQDVRICRANDVADSLFYVKRGSLIQLAASTGKAVKIFRRGDFFGVKSGDTHRTYPYTIKTLTSCDLYEIKLSDVEEMNKHPFVTKQMLDFFSLIKDKKFSFQKNDEDLGEELIKIQSEMIKQNMKTVAETLDADSAFIGTWRFISLFLAWFQSCFVVFLFGFTTYDRRCYLVCYLIDCWFIVDLFVSFHVTFMDKFQVKVKNISIIRYHYYKTPSKFLLSACACCPYETFILLFPLSAANRVYYFYLFRLNRTLHFITVVMSLNKWEATASKNILLLRVFKFLLIYFFIANFCSCIWYLIACPLKDCNENTWVDAPTIDYLAGKQYKPSLILWFDSLYWFVATTTSTGFGDVSGTTIDEMIYSCFVMLLGKLLIGYVLGLASVTITNNQLQFFQFEEKAKRIQGRMERLKLDAELKDTVTRLLDCVWLKSNGVNVMKLFTEIPDTMQSELFSSIYSESLKSVKIFANCSSHFIRKLSTEVTPISFLPKNYLARKGDVRDVLFIMLSGRAKVYKNQNGKDQLVRDMVDGDVFMPESVLKKTRRWVSVKAATYVDALFLSMSGLKKTLDSYPKDKKILKKNIRLLYPKIINPKK